MKKWSGNVNHPKKGERIEVDPIMRINDIKSIAKLTENNPRDHLLFIMEKIGKVGDIPYLDFFTKKIHDKRKRAGGISLTELAELKKVTRKTIESIREREEN